MEDILFKGEVGMTRWRTWKLPKNGILIGLLIIALSGLKIAQALSPISLTLNQSEKIFIPPLAGYVFITQLDSPIYKHFYTNCCDNKQLHNSLLGVGVLDAEQAINLSQARQKGIENPYSRYIAFEKLEGEYQGKLSKAAWGERKDEIKKAFQQIYKEYTLSDLAVDPSKIKSFKLATLTKNRQLVPLGYIDDTNHFSTFTLTHITPADPKVTALSISPTTGYSITQLYLHETILTLIVHQVINDPKDLERLVTQTNEVIQQILTLNK